MRVRSETETWQCLLCVNFAEVGAGGGEEAAPGGGLPPRLQKLVERITLELYCQYELSLAFREPVPPEHHHYHSKVRDRSSRRQCIMYVALKVSSGTPRQWQRHSC